MKGRNGAVTSVSETFPGAVDEPAAGGNIQAPSTDTVAVLMGIRSNA
ncbi:MAG: hypothetical protein PGN37_20425 [Mycobacterium kyogaense]